MFLTVGFTLLATALMAVLRYGYCVNRMDPRAERAVWFKWRDRGHGARWFVTPLLVLGCIAAILHFVFIQ